MTGEPKKFLVSKRRDLSKYQYTHSWDFFDAVNSSEETQLAFSRGETSMKGRNLDKYLKITREKQLKLHRIEEEKRNRIAPEPFNSLLKLQSFNGQFENLAAVMKCLSIPQWVTFEKNSFYSEVERATALAIAAIRQEYKLFNVLGDYYDKAIKWITSNELIYEARDLIVRYQFLEQEESTNAGAKEDEASADTFGGYSITDEIDRMRAEEHQVEDAQSEEGACSAVGIRDEQDRERNNRTHIDDDTGLSNNDMEEEDDHQMLASSSSEVQFPTEDMPDFAALVESAYSRPMTSGSGGGDVDGRDRFHQLKSTLTSMTIVRDEDRIKLQQRRVDEIQLRVIELCVEIEYVVIDVVQCKDRCVQAYNQSETLAARYRTFNELTCRLGDGFTGSSGYDDWRRNDVKGVRPLVVDFLCKVQEMAEERLTLEELETPQGRTPKSSTSTEWSRRRWRLKWNGHDVVLRVLHCLDFLRKVRELSDWYGPGFYFAANPLMLPFPYGLALERLELGEKVRDQLESFAHLRRGTGKPEEKAGWLHQQFLNKFRHLFRETCDKAWYFNWPLIPSVKEDAQNERMYTAILVLFIACQESIERSNSWEKSFIALLNTARGRKKLIGQASENIQCRPEIPSIQDVKASLIAESQAIYRKKERAISRAQSSLKKVTAAVMASNRILKAVQPSPSRRLSQQVVSSSSRSSTRRRSTQVGSGRLKLPDLYVFEDNVLLEQSSSTLEFGSDSTLIDGNKKPNSAEIPLSGTGKGKGQRATQQAMSQKRLGSSAKTVENRRGSIAFERQKLKAMGISGDQLRGKSAENGENGAFRSQGHMLLPDRRNKRLTLSAEQRDLKQGNLQRAHQFLALANQKTAAAASGEDVEEGDQQARSADAPLEKEGEDMRDGGNGEEQEKEIEVVAREFGDAVKPLSNRIARKPSMFSSPTRLLGSPTTTTTATTAARARVVMAPGRMRVPSMHTNALRSRPSVLSGSGPSRPAPSTLQTHDASSTDREEADEDVYVGVGEDGDAEGAKERERASGRVPARRESILRRNSIVRKASPSPQQQQQQQQQFASLSRGQRKAISEKNSSAEVGEGEGEGERNLTETDKSVLSPNRKKSANPLRRASTRTRTTIEATEKVATTATEQLSSFDPLNSAREQDDVTRAVKSDKSASVQHVKAQLKRAKLDSANAERSIDDSGSTEKGRHVGLQPPDAGEKASLSSAKKGNKFRMTGTLVETTSTTQPQDNPQEEGCSAGRRKSTKQDSASLPSSSAEHSTGMSEVTSSDSSSATAPSATDVTEQRTAKTRIHRASTSGASGAPGEGGESGRGGRREVAATLAAALQANAASPTASHRVTRFPVSTATPADRPNDTKSNNKNNDKNDTSTSSSNAIYTGRNSSRPSIGFGGRGSNGSDGSGGCRGREAWSAPNNPRLPAESNSTTAASSSQQALQQEQQQQQQGPQLADGEDGSVGSQQQGSITSGNSKSAKRLTRRKS